jgi:RimJ/RimL family protein N-acetyltransferase
MLTRPVVVAGSMAARVQPEIDGDGVRLRPWLSGDVGVVVAGFADPAIQRWHCRSLDAAEAAAWIAGWAGRWRAESDAAWAVTAYGVVVGQVGLRQLDLHDGLGSVSYWMLPQARGRGLAVRALAALTSWSFAELGLDRLGLSHSTANVASCRVASKAGFAVEGTLRAQGWHADGRHDMHLHARIRHDLP